MEVNKEDKEDKEADAREDNPSSSSSASSSSSPSFQDPLSLPKDTEHRFKRKKIDIDSAEDDHESFSMGEEPECGPALDAMLGNPKLKKDDAPAPKKAAKRTSWYDKSHRMAESRFTHAFFYIHHYSLLHGVH